MRCTSTMTQVESVYLACLIYELGERGLKVVTQQLAC